MPPGRPGSCKGEEHPYAGGPSSTSITYGCDRNHVASLKLRFLIWEAGQPGLPHIHRCGGSGKAFWNSEASLPLQSATGRRCPKPWLLRAAGRGSPRAGSLQTDERGLQASPPSKSHMSTSSLGDYCARRLENTALSDDCRYRYNDDIRPGPLHSVPTCHQNWAQRWLPDAGRAVPAATRSSGPTRWARAGSQRKQGLCPLLSLTLPLHLQPHSSLPARARTHLHGPPPRRLRPLPRGRPPPVAERSHPALPGSSTGAHAILITDAARQPSPQRPPGPPARPPPARGSLPAEPRPSPRSLRRALLRREQTPGRSRPSALGLRGRLPPPP